ncbi:hypothetical protein BU17DRAFT_80343 [Hysterangium stoloniferum]|nr:hypothetical protein BU17DRAFT_80343 [Hysterangium stoloniferum]
MSLKNHHQYIQPSSLNSRPSDHETRTLASYFHSQKEPARRQSVSSQESLTLRRVDGQQSNPRERQSNNGNSIDHHRSEEAGSSRQYETSSQISPAQYSRNDQQMSRTSTMESLEPSYSRSQSRSRSHLRHPNLSLDTNHAPNQPHHFSSRSSGDNSPSFSPSVNPNLNADLQVLRSGLESVWSLTSKQLHSLHTTLAAKAEQNQTLSATHGQLQTSIVEQHEALSREVERLRAENAKLAAEKLNIDETRRHAIYEREVLGIANERLWEDKVKLEGEKRELKVKLDAETEYSRLCQQELAKRDGQTVNPNASQADERPVRVKMEVDEAGSDQTNSAQIPLVQVEEVIYARLKHQADDFGREIRDVYENLAKSQTRATELEALLRRYVNPSNPNQTPQHLNNPPGGQAIPPPVQPYSRLHPSALSPVTPQTAILSSVSEADRSEFPFRRSSTSKPSGPHPDYPRVNRGGNQQPPLANIPSYQRRVSGPVISTEGRAASESSQRRYSAPTDTGSTSGGGSADVSPALDSMAGHASAATEEDFAATAGITAATLE